MSGECLARDRNCLVRKLLTIHHRCLNKAGGERVGGGQTDRKGGGGWGEEEEMRERQERGREDVIW